MLSRVSLGRGNSPPARTSSTHIIQGVLGIRFAPLLLYLRHAGFATISTRFCRFSPIFAPFSVFLAPWPHAAHGTRSRKTEPGRREPQNPLGGGEKNHAPGGEPGRAQHSAGAGDGLPPPSQGRSAAQRQRGGTHRGRAAGGGGDRRERAATGSRAAQRRGRPAAGRPPGGAGTTNRPPPTPQTRRTGDERLAKRGGLAARPPTADASCGRAAEASGWGLWPPPERGTSRAKRCNAAPRRGGPPPPGPTLQVCMGAANNALAPRPQVADGGTALGLVDERIGVCVPDV